MSLARRAALVAALVALAGCSTTSLGMTELSVPTIAAVTTTLATSEPAPATAEPATAVPPGPTSIGEIPTAVPTTALEGLAQLPVKGKAPLTGYDRDLFGQRWSDDVEVDGGHNGCDTRNDVLRRDLTDTVIKPNTAGCVAAGGLLDDPFTAEQILFLRGADTSADVQIDHLVALANAWQTGAQLLTEERRTALANDPLELLAVDGGANQSKGAGDAATWLPPNKSFRCAYVARQVAVKLTYDLWVTPAEHGAIDRVLSGCPDEPLPTYADPDVVVPEPVRPG